MSEHDDGSRCFANPDDDDPLVRFRLSCSIHAVATTVEMSRSLVDDERIDIPVLLEGLGRVGVGVFSGCAETCQIEKGEI
jgi:hypothetical protein